MRVARAVTLLTFGVLATRPIAAQQLSGGFVILSADHELLGDPLVGGQLGMRFDIGASRFSVHAGATGVQQSADRIGIPCAGLIPPGGECAEQPIRDDGSYREVAVGAGFRVLGSGLAELGLTTDLSIGRVDTDSHGSVNGRVLSAERMLLGVSVGAEGAMYFSRRSPLAVEVQVSLGRFRPRAIEQIADGYTPYENGFDASRIRLGVAWRPRAR